MKAASFSTARRKTFYALPFRIRIAATGEAATGQLVRLPSPGFLPPSSPPSHSRGPRPPTPVPPPRRAFTLASSPPLPRLAALISAASVPAISSFLSQSRRRVPSIPALIGATFARSRCARYRGRLARGDSVLAPQCATLSPPVSLFVSLQKLPRGIGYLLFAEILLVYVTLSILERKKKRAGSRAVMASVLMVFAALSLALILA
jgi:hypothetical protein